MLECYTVLKNTWNNFSTHAAVDPNHTLKPSHHNSVSRRWPLFLLIHVCFWSLGCLLLHNHKTVVWHVHMNIHFLPHVQFVYFWGGFVSVLYKGKDPKERKKSGERGNVMQQGARAGPFLQPYYMVPGELPRATTICLFWGGHITPSQTQLQMLL